MFLLNINSRTIHRAESVDGRCRLSQVKECHRVVFETYAEAKHYLPAGGKESTPCSFCLGPNYSDGQEDRRETE